jgi:uncharacterized membrane protein YphA (DoxX/SURF4 family)
MQWTYDETRQRAGALLWIVQVLVAAVFLFAAYAKLTMPAAQMAKMSPLPVPFLRFIAVCELAGALGLILPGLLHIHEELTPLAAAGLVVIMIGAVTVTLATMPATFAILPFVNGLATLYIAYRQWGKLRRPRRSRAGVPQPSA